MTTKSPTPFKKKSSANSVSLKTETHLSSKKLSSVPPLTPKEKLVLEFIEGFIVSSGVSPSYQEIKDHFGLASFNSVQNYLKQLSSKGYVSNPKDQKRAISVLRPASSAQQNLKDHLHHNQVSTKTGSPRTKLLQAREEILSIPLLGKVAAGVPLEALEFDEFIDVPPSLLKQGDSSFALKVQGDSMIEDGIFDQDIILIQQQSSASHGDIIVATIENEATVKRIYFHSKSNSTHQDKKIELRPANHSMKSMWFAPHEIEIRGKVVGLIRKF